MTYPRSGQRGFDRTSIKNNLHPLNTYDDVTYDRNAIYMSRPTGVRPYVDYRRTGMVYVKVSDRTKADSPKGFILVPYPIPNELSA